MTPPFGTSIRRLSRAALIGGSSLLLGHASTPGRLESARVPSGRAANTIMVTTANDAMNGDVSSVAALLANPGPDGVSLHEAVAATNNDPGSWTIRFATLQPIPVEIALLLKGGNVTIEGPATLVAKPGVSPRPSGLRISSSGNTLRALTLEGFQEAAGIWPVSVPLPAGVTYADNTIEQLTIRGADNGVTVQFWSPECNPCQTHNRWVNTTIRDNVIEAARSGIYFTLGTVIGDVVDGVTITGNTLRIGTTAEPDGDGPPLQVDVAGNSVSTRIANVLIADNTIETVQSGSDGAIIIVSGLQRARQSIIEDVRVLRNRIHVDRPSGSVLCCFGIFVSAGSDYFAFDPGQFTGFPDDNVVRRVEVSDNEIVGPLAVGVQVQAGASGGGSRNRVETVSVRRNVISSTTVSRGVYLWTGQIGQGLTVTGNSIADAEIDSNTITTGVSAPFAGTDSATAGGVVLIAGGAGGRDGLIDNVRIINNQITTAYAGVRLIGGATVFANSPDAAQANTVRCVRITGNRVQGTSTAMFARANVGNASGNSLIFFMPDSGGVVMPDLAGAPFPLVDPLPTGC